jgi:SAM-dependent methyltransferase
MISELETIHCDLCGSGKYTRSLQVTDYRYGHSEIFDIVRCDDCGLIYLNPRPKAGAILKQYEHDYTPDSIVDKRSQTSKISFRAKLKKKLGRIWYWIGGYYGVSQIKIGGRFLDIGCADGNILETVRDAGADAYGIEINPRYVDLCRDKGLNVQCGSVEDLRYPDNYFDIIWMSQVVEHLRSPKNCLQQLRRILKQDGKLYLFCPNAESYLAKLFKKYWHGWHIPFHFYAFTANNIEKLAAETGFKITSLRTMTPYHFFSVSLKSVISGQRKAEPMKRHVIVDSLLFGAVISVILRTLDFACHGRGDCLKVVLEKDG